METTKKSIQQVGITIGLITSLCLISYFSLMKAFGLAQITQLRYLNFFILLGGILYAYQHFRQPGHNIDYLPGIGLGFITTVVSVVPFSAFLYFYFTFVDSDLLEAIKNSSVMMVEYLTPFTVAGTIIIEGMASGAILSFLLMQYYKSGFEKSERKGRERASWNRSYQNS